MTTPKYTHLRFAAIVVGIVAVYCALFALLLFYPTPERPIQYDNFRDLISEDPGIIPAVLYLCFVLGWAVAYSTFFKFPQRISILLIGVLLSAGVLTSALLLGAGAQNELGEMTFPLQIITGFFASSLGAAFQLFFVVISLQIVKAIWKRAFKTKKMTDQSHLSLRGN